MLKITIEAELEKDAEPEPIILNREVTDDNGIYLWKGVRGESWIKIYERNDGSVDKIEKDQSVVTSRDDISARFAEKKVSISEIESFGIEYTDESDIELDYPGPHPYDPELIRVETKQFNISLINEYINDRDIDLAPDFQRHFVWNEITKRSRLIESIMLRIPLPVFYLAQDDEGRFQVVDGLQRLTVINQFLENKFKLKGLEYLKDCEGKYFKNGVVDSIESKYVRRISQTQLVCNVIDPQTPSRVKFDIFKRINQGGKPLKPQEIRNCMALPSARKFLKNLANSEVFVNATGGVATSRMQDQELVLRFIAFYISRNNMINNYKYTGTMEVFLDDALDHINSNSVNLELIENAFNKAMKNAHYLFTSYAFRKCLPQHLLPGARRQLLNNSLFTTWSVLLAEYEPSMISSMVGEGGLLESTSLELEVNEGYYDAVTNGTNDLRRLNYAFTVAEKLLNSVVTS